MHTYTHTHGRTILNHKKEGNTCICNNMDEPGGGHYSKWNKPEKEKYHYHVIYVGNLKKSQICRNGG